MLKLLSEFLRSPGNFFQDERNQRMAVISLFSLLFVCILFSVTKGAARQRNGSPTPDSISTPMIPTSTQTKWWIRHEPSETPTGSLAGLRSPIVTTGTPIALKKCAVYAADFKPGVFGYISLFPPYENLLRSAAGKDYPVVGFIEVGGWVKILREPVCTDDGYVWLNVESAVDSNSWTAGGYQTAQWVIPCPDPSKKCNKRRPAGPTWTTPDASKENDDSANDLNSCVSERLAVALDAQVSPSNLLVIRSEPFTGAVLGHIAPLTVINIIDGPRCAGGAVWWKVVAAQTGWAVENNLLACPKEGECDPWKIK